MTTRVHFLPRVCAMAVALAAATALALTLGIPPRAGGQGLEPGVNAYKVKGDEGRLAGVVYFDGAPPERTVVEMGADSYCAKVDEKDRLAEDVLAEHGRLADVFVYVKSAALDGAEFETPRQAAVLERRKCRTVPRLLGVRAGQDVIFRNGDQTTHNFNIQSLKNEKSNMSVPPGGGDIVFKYENPERFIPVKCNQHPWEKGYIGVFSHPFFAVSDGKGFFTIEGLPPGRYTVVAWHVKLGAQTAEVEVGVRESKNVDFTFKARAETTAAPSPWNAP